MSSQIHSLKKSAGTHYSYSVLYQIFGDNKRTILEEQ